MESERKVKIITLVAVIIAVIGLTIAFAAMSRTLNIHGSGTMDPANWDIYFENISSPVLVGEASVSGSPNLATKGAEITNLNATLKQPNDSVTWTVDITNDGDVNAEISQINLPSLTNAQSQLFEFSATYTNEYEHGHIITVGDMLYAGETRNITIVFKYKDITDESLLPSSPEAINLSYSINYIQSNREITTEQSGGSQNGGLVQNNCTPFLKKDNYSVGDEIALCNTSTGKSEDFYVISDNGTTVTALAKYNLLVGNVYSDVTDDLTPILSNTDGYGLQSSSAIGYLEDANVYTGVMPFSEMAYWDDGGYPKYVFNNNSNLWTPVWNYQTYLTTTLGKTSATATLMSKEQADSIKSSNNDNLPAWAFNTSYWLGTAGSTDRLWNVYSDGVMNAESRCDDGILDGVRPVITIAKSDL